jgi:hypothetical protein
VHLKKEKRKRDNGRVVLFPRYNRLARLQETSPRLNEIISDGKVKVIGTETDALQLRNLIGSNFEPPRDEILSTAWSQFAVYDLNSTRHRTQWHLFKKVPLYLGILSTLMVLIYSASGDIPYPMGSSPNDPWISWYINFMTWLAYSIQDLGGWNLFVRYTIILLQITVLIIIDIEIRQKLGSKSAILRAAAEAVKRGIYSYRVLGHLQGHGNAINEIMLPSTRQRLATHLTRVGNTIRDSDVNVSALIAYEGPLPPSILEAEAEDDGFSSLDPDAYVKIRIGSQIKYHTLRTKQLEGKLSKLQYLILIIGGIGVFLTFLGAQYWLPFTVTIIMAATAILEYQQLEEVITKYNLARSGLENIRSAWLALSADERSWERNIRRLVRDVEAILEPENQNWGQFLSQVQEGQENDVVPGEG